MIILVMTNIAMYQGKGWWFYLCTMYCACLNVPGTYHIACTYASAELFVTGWEYNSNDTNKLQSFGALN